MELACNLKPGENSSSSWAAFDTAPAEGMVSLVSLGPAEPLEGRWAARSELKWVTPKRLCPRGGGATRAGSAPAPFLTEAMSREMIKGDDHAT